MTAPTMPTAELTGIAQRSIDATTTAVRTWTETLDSYAGSISTDNPLPRTAELRTAVGAWFDLAASLLSEQRALVFTLVDSGAETAGSWTEQVRSAAASLPFRPMDITGRNGAAA